MTQPHRHITTKILWQGAVVPNTAHTRYESDDCIVVELDLVSKYIEITGSAGHRLFLNASEHSQHLHASRDRSEFTFVEFELPPGEWRFACGSGSRYSVTACFLKVQEP